MSSNPEQTMSTTKSSPQQVYKEVQVPTLLTCLLAYKEQISYDATEIWESEEMLRYFPDTQLERLRTRWCKATMEWLHSEICRRQEEQPRKKKKSLIGIYSEYVAHFQKLASIMLRKKRQEVITTAMKAYKNEFILSTGEETQHEEATMLSVLSHACQHETEASTLSFNLVREHPHELLALVR